MKQYLSRRQTERKTYHFEWNDLRALITVVNVGLIIAFGLQVAWFGLIIASLGLLKDLTELRTDGFRISSVVIHMANILLNVCFICKL